jgi:hypothetical protein
MQPAPANSASTAIVVRRAFMIFRIAARHVAGTKPGSHLAVSA